MLRRCSCKSKTTCNGNACVCLVLMMFEQGEWREVPLLVLTDSLPGAADIVFVLPHLWLACNLSVIRCYGFDSKFYLDEQCYSSMVKVISLQQRGLSFPSFKKMDSGSFFLKQLGGRVNQAALWSSLTGNTTLEEAETESQTLSQLSEHSAGSLIWSSQ